MTSGSHPTPFTHPTPHHLHPPHPAPYTPCTLHPSHPTPHTLHTLQVEDKRVSGWTSKTVDFFQLSRELIAWRHTFKLNDLLAVHPSTLNPQPSTLNPQPSTLNPQPSTLNPQPSTLKTLNPIWPSYTQLDLPTHYSAVLHIPPVSEPENPSGVSATLRAFAGDATPCRMTRVTLHSHVRYKKI